MAPASKKAQMTPANNCAQSVLRAHSEEHGTRVSSETWGGSVGSRSSVGEELDSSSSISLAGSAQADAWLPERLDCFAQLQRVIEEAEASILMPGDHLEDSRTWRALQGQITESVADIQILQALVGSARETALRLNRALTSRSVMRIQSSARCFLAQSHLWELDRARNKHMLVEEADVDPTCSSESPQSKSKAKRHGKKSKALTDTLYLNCEPTVRANLAGAMTGTTISTSSTITVSVADSRLVATNLAAGQRALGAPRALPATPVTSGVVQEDGDLDKVSETEPFIPGDVINQLHYPKRGPPKVLASSFGVVVTDELVIDSSGGRKTNFGGYHAYGVIDVRTGEVKRLTGKDMRRARRTLASSTEHRKAGRLCMSVLDLLDLGLLKVRELVWAIYLQGENTGREVYLKRLIDSGHLDSMSENREDVSRMIMRLFRAERNVHVTTWSNVTALGRLLIDLSCPDAMVTSQPNVELGEDLGVSRHAEQCEKDNKMSKKRPGPRAQTNAKVIQAPFTPQEVKEGQQIAASLREEDILALASDDDVKCQSFEELLAELKAELCQQSIGSCGSLVSEAARTQI